MKPKYRILKDEHHKRVVDGVTLYRIQAAREFSLDYNEEFIINEGELGGFVESEANLSQDGRCWIADNACVMGCAIVEDHAYVGGDVIIHSGYIYDRANVRGKIQIYDGVNICHDASIEGRQLLT